MHRASMPICKLKVICIQPLTVHIRTTTEYILQGKITFQENKQVLCESRVEFCSF